MKQCPIDFFDPEVQHLAASAGCRLYRMQNDTDRKSTRLNSSHRN